MALCRRSAHRRERVARSWPGLEHERAFARNDPARVGPDPACRCRHTRGLRSTTQIQSAPSGGASSGSANECGAGAGPRLTTSRRSSAWSGVKNLSANASGGGPRHRRRRAAEGEGRLSRAAAQADRYAARRPRRASSLVEIELAPLEGPGRAGSASLPRARSAMEGNCVRNSAVPCGRQPPVRLEIGEIQKRRRGRELLPLKQHRRAGRQQQQRRHRAPAAGARQLCPRSPRAEFATWSWFCRKTTNAAGGSPRPACRAASAASDSAGPGTDSRTSPPR